MSGDLVTKGELEEWISSLLKHFEMDHGYPSTYVMTENGPEHGVVGDDLGLILENGLELLGSLREDLDIYPEEFEIEWEFYGAENIDEGEDE